MSEALEHSSEPPSPAPPPELAEVLKSKNVTHLESEGRDLYIVGTAHVSPKSVEEVKRVIDAVKPDTVCVELDEMRHESLVDDTRWRKLDIFQVIRQKKVLYLLASIVLGAYQRRMGEQMGVKPGSELLAAVEKAEEVGAELVLADRHIQATLKRTWANLSFWNKGKVLSAMMGAFYGAGEITEEQLEELKDRDTITEMMQEFARVMPQVQKPLIDERDQYLMTSVERAPGKTIVAVVGAGHVQGMINYTGKPADLEALAVIPPPSKLGAVLKWLLPVVVLAAFYWGYTETSEKNFQEMVYGWVIPNAVGAALFSALARAKPLTVLIAGLASPITSLNPTINAGVVAGLVEAWQRKPTVEDCEGLQDISGTASMFKNNFTHVLLVFVAATLGSAVGAWVGGAWVLSLLGGE